METRKSNIAVWEDTYKQSETGYFSIAEIQPSIKYTFKDLKDVKLTSKYLYPTLEIVNEDTFTMAQKLVEFGYNPLVLNMASDLYPGGGVRKGCFAQEENLFRRSNYYKFLPYNEFYPIQEDEIIYSPNILVFKDKYYNIIRDPFEVSCIACAAIRNPLLNWTSEPTIGDHSTYQTYVNPDDYELTRDKIRAIFITAYKHDHDSLVLGALGCGAFHNPPEEIAKIFNELLKEYRNCFKYFCFAVLSLKDQNYITFRKIINL